jgi:hypothetical protein
MTILPAEMLPLIPDFALLFSNLVWEHAKMLRIEVLPPIGNRTVTA